MAKIKDCVVIEREVLKNVIIQLQYLGQNNIVGMLRGSSKSLEPIVKDAWNKKDTTLYDYLNEKEI